jgi:hypothetical protein
LLDERLLLPCQGISSGSTGLLLVRGVGEFAATAGVTRIDSMNILIFCHEEMSFLRGGNPG